MKSIHFIVLSFSKGHINKPWWIDVCDGFCGNPNKLREHSVVTDEDEVVLVGGFLCHHNLKLLEWSCACIYTLLL